MSCPTCGGEMVRVDVWRRQFPGEARGGDEEHSPADCCPKCRTLIEVRDDGDEGYSERPHRDAPWNLVIDYCEPKIGEVYYG